MILLPLHSVIIAIILLGTCTNIGLLLLGTSFLLAKSNCPGGMYWLDNYVNIVTEKKNIFTVLDLGWP